MSPDLSAPATLIGPTMVVSSARQSLCAAGFSVGGLLHLRSHLPISQAAGRVGGSLVDHLVVVVRSVGGDVQSVGAHHVALDAQFDGLGLIERSDDDRRLAEEVHGPLVGLAE